jgi:hypothetical protein
MEVPANVRLRRNYLQDTNALAYFVRSKSEIGKKNYNIGAEKEEWIEPFFVPDMLYVFTSPHSLLFYIVTMVFWRRHNKLACLFVRKLFDMCE